MPRAGWLAILVVLVLTVAGCGRAAEELMEQAIENEIEEEGGSGNVEVDLDEEGGVSIETDEGTFQIGGGEIPDDFLLPIPDYGEVQMVSSQTGEFAGASVSVTFDPDDFDDVVELYEDFFTDEGWEVNRTETTSGDDRMVLVFAEGPDLDASAMVVYAEGDDSANLTVQYANN